MSLFVRIDGRDLNILDASYQQKQSEIGTFEVIVPAQDVPDRSALLYADIALYRRGERVISGVVLELPQLTLSEDKALRTKITAYQELGRLTCYRAMTDAHFQDQSVVGILGTLLATTPDWALGSAVTMDDPTVTTTVDLRNKESLFAQIAETIKSVPRLFLRYGGIQAGKHVVDIGFFGQQRYYAVQHEAITALKLDENNKRYYRLVEAYADKSNDSRITLLDALAYPGIATHPDWARFPIQNISGKGVVIDLDRTRGCEISKAFNVHKAANDGTPATSAQIAEVGFALWQKSVRYLQGQTPATTMQLSAFLRELPVISDKVFVRAEVDELAIDPFTNEETRISTFYTEGWYRITSLGCKFAVQARQFDPANVADEGSIVDSYDMTVTDNDYHEDVDNDVALYEKTERFDSADKNSTAIGQGIKGIALVPVTHSNADPADCGSGKSYTFPLPAIPTGSTLVTGAIVSSNPAGAVFTITQFPALPATPLIACVEKLGGGWPPSGSQQVTVQYTFY